MELSPDHLVESRIKEPRDAPAADGTAAHDW